MTTDQLLLAEDVGAVVGGALVYFTATRRFHVKRINESVWTECALVFVLAIIGLAIMRSA